VNVLKGYLYGEIHCFTLPENNISIHKGAQSWCVEENSTKNHHNQRQNNDMFIRNNAFLKKRAGFKEAQRNESYC
jgi:hypothetical protein